MKKIKWLVTVLIVVSITLGIIGCINPSNPSNLSNPSNSSNSSGSDDGETQQGGANGGNSGEQPEGGTQVLIPEGFVFVKGATVTGALPAWLDESASDYYKGVFKGVFIEGRTVTLSDFYMGKYEVTQEEYASVMLGQKVTVEGVEYALESNPSYCTADSTSYTLFNGDVQEKRPVEGLTWYDSVWYCNALSQKEGLTPAYNIEVTEVKQESGKTGYYIYSANVTLNKNATGYRLPTEAEWEYAARGGDPTKYDWNYMFSGADTAAGVSYSVSYNSTKNAGLDRVGWYEYNSINGTTGGTSPSDGEQGYGTHQVGKKAPNRLGLYDMSGNVWEWCYDWYGTVSTGTDTDPTGDTSGFYRVTRGGSWNYGASSASVCNSNCSYPYSRDDYCGFRVVRSAIYEYTVPEVIEKLEHKHKFATDWTKDETHHWYAATCGHTTEVSEKAKHSFGDWTITKETTKEAKGSKERVCTVCNHKEVVDIAKIPEDFVLIPAGTFQMGSKAGDSYNKPVHQVTITKSFYMGKYEVTQAEYEKYCSYGRSPSSSWGDGDNYPAYFVSWYDALVYCNKRSIAEGLIPCYSMSGNIAPEIWGTVPTISDKTWNAVVCDWNANGYRLPTEAEWEYAARAGDNTVDSLTYSGTSVVNELGEYAWYSSNSSSKTHEVGTKKANTFGLYDMSGNVYEWCWNRFTSGYDENTEGGNNPTGSSVVSSRINRGGSWNYNSDHCAVSCRGGSEPDFRHYNLGFRVVRLAN